MKAVAALALATLLCVGSVAKQTQPEPELVPYARLKMGESVMCSNPAGCISFANEAFTDVVREAIRRAVVDACSQGRAL